MSKRERELYHRRLCQFTPDLKAFLELRWQGQLRIEPPEVWLTIEECQKLIEDAVMKWNATEQSARLKRLLQDPQAICHSAIARARDTSAVAIQLARQAERSPAPRPKADHSFGAVMSRFPEIADWALSERQRLLLSGSFRNLRAHHRHVLQSLGQAGLGCDEYPFTSHSLGFRAFCDWLRRELGRGLT